MVKYGLQEQIKAEEWMPCTADGYAKMQGVLRLQFCFASRSKIFAQDDTA